MFLKPAIFMFLIWSCVFYQMSTAFIVDLEKSKLPTIDTRLILDVGDRLGCPLRNHKNECVYPKKRTFKTNSNDFQFPRD